MLLKLKNIGKIDYGEICLDGLTVIAGLNDSGKSSVGKSLFSLISAYNMTENYTEEHRLLQMMKLVNYFYERYSNTIIDYLHMPESPDAFMSIYESDEDSIKNCVKEAINNVYSLDNTPRNVNIVRRDLNDIRRLIEKKDKDKLFKDTLRNKIMSEFRDKFQRIGTNHAALLIEEHDFVLGLEIENFNNEEFSIINEGKVSLFSDVTYIESPLFMREYPTYFVNRENSHFGRQAYHIFDFCHKIDSFKTMDINLNENVNSGILDFIDTVSSISNGYFSRNENSDALKWNDKAGNEFYPINVASGIKSLGVLQMLIQSGYVDTNKLLIWDEPENHLHPEWQIKLAEILVQLAALGVPVLVNSHSPYFIQAIRYYASKSKVEKYVRYYLSEDNEDNSIRLDEVTDDLNRLFYKLAEPLDSIMNM